LERYQGFSSNFNIVVSKMQSIYENIYVEQEGKESEGQKT